MMRVHDTHMQGMHEITVVRADEESQNKAKAAKAAKKKAKKQGKAVATDAAAPVCTDGAHDGSAAAAATSAGSAPQSEAHTGSQRGSADCSSKQQSPRNAAALQNGRLGSNAFDMLSEESSVPTDSWQDVPARRMSKDKAHRTTPAAPAAASVRKHAPKRGMTVEGRQNSVQSHTQLSSTQQAAAGRTPHVSVASGSKRSNSGIEGSSKRGGKEGRGKRNGTAAWQASAHISAAPQAPAVLQAHVSHAKSSARTAAGDGGGTLLKNSVWGDRPIAPAPSRAGVVAVPSKAGSWDAAHRADGNSSASEDHGSTLAVWRRGAEPNGASAFAADADAWDHVPPHSLSGCSHDVPAPGPSDNGSLLQRQASAFSEDWPRIHAARAVTEAEGQDLTAVWAVPAANATVRSDAVPPGSTHDPAVGRHSIDAAHESERSSMCTDSTPMAVPTAPAAQPPGDGWSPLTGAGSRYGEWRGMGGSPELDSILRHALDGDDVSPESADTREGAAGAAHAAHMPLRSTDIGAMAGFERAAYPAQMPSHGPAQHVSGGWTPWQPELQVSSKQPELPPQHGLWPAQGHPFTALPQPRHGHQQAHMQDWSQADSSHGHSTEGGAEPEPEWAVPLSGTPLPLGMLHHGTFVAQQ